MGANPYGRVPSGPSGAGDLASVGDGVGEGVEDLAGLVPVDAGVGDALAVDERLAWDDVLAAFDEMAFDHDAGDGVVSGADLAGDVVGDGGLVAVVLIGVAVGAIDHDGGDEAGFLEESGDLGDGGGVVIGAGFAAAEDDVAGGVAGGFDDGGDALFGDAEEAVWAGGGADGVDGDADAAAGAVFEADGHAEAAGEFAVDLAFDGASADGTPCDEIGDVLGADGVEEFGAAGDFHFREGGEELACEAEAAVDVEAFVEAWVVDVAFPADGGAWFFEVDAHDDAEVFGVSACFVADEGGVFEGGFFVVDGAGAGDDEEAVIASLEDGFCGAAAVGDEFEGLVTRVDVVHEDFR